MAIPLVRARQAGECDLTQRCTHVPFITYFPALVLIPAVTALTFHHDTHVMMPSEIRPVRNDPKALAKPRGGLWTSSYDPDYGSGWVRWCLAYRYHDPLDLHWTVLSVAKSARIAVIDSRPTWELHSALSSQ